MIGDVQTKALLAVLDGARTVRQVASTTGRSSGTAYRALLRLRDAGLVAFEPRRAGTLRPLVREVRR